MNPVTLVRVDDPPEAIGSESVAVGAVAAAVREGLAARPRRLPPWLFYDEAGSLLFERITELPEYLSLIHI